ncbi:GSCOCG00011879001-RA-CDS [Cotesia congregata]|nr:GSCOCG00011879001-RA-CDS [Cotesia congregata]
MNGIVLEYVERVKYLGLVLDNTLSWHGQMVSVSQQAMSCLARLKMNSRVLNTTMRRRLVVALILPIFDYGCAVLTNISGSLQQRLQRKFNACIRFIYGVPRFDHITPYRRQLGWLTLRSRREFLIACIIYKMLHLQHNNLLRDGFRILLSVRDRAERRNDIFYQSSCRKVTFERSFLLTAIRSWNQLPSDLVALSTFAEFRVACFNWYFNRDL